LACELRSRRGLAVDAVLDALGRLEADNVIGLLRVDGLGGPLIDGDLVRPQGVE
jgi:hypothetical protein